MTKLVMICAAVAMVLILAMPAPPTAGMGICSHAQRFLAAQDQAEPTWIQRTPGDHPSPRSGHAMAYDSAREVIVLFGGSSNQGRFSDTWEWDGTAWARRFPADSPPALTNLAMAYDSVRGVTVLFGGYTSTALSTTWEWDGTNWTQRLPANSPPARSRHAMAYDSARGVTILFGGYVVGSGGTIVALGDTWEWDGTSWTQRAPASIPNGRYHHAMAYDSMRQVTVLFGGNAGGGRLNDTWEWDGTNWTRRTPASSPPAQNGHAMAFDRARGVTVFYGSQFRDNTWEWDGTDWVQQITAASPTIRYYHTLAYDAARGVTVLFGGYHSYLVGSTQHRIWYGETWEYIAGDEPNPEFEIFLPLMLCG